MPKIAPADDDVGIDPTPCYATDAEIALAEHLRRQLEERYFGTSATTLLVRERWDNVH
ncbi:MAG: hypothetical protein ABI593_09540 [Betaproteobacteria bacterium]